jgi:predicted cupin superfamily sugar epimerase
MFRSVYQSKEKLDDGRDMCNAIFYLLSDGAFSHLHRLQSDEIYHYYYGDPLEILELMPDGTSRHILLGNDYLNGQVPQAVIRAGSWHGSRCSVKGGFSFVGTSMSPGFTEENYEHCLIRDQLIEQFPQWKELILALTD